MVKLQKALFASSLFVVTGLGGVEMAQAAQTPQERSSQLRILGQGQGYIDVQLVTGKVSIDPALALEPGYVQVSMQGQNARTTLVGAPSLPMMSSLLQLPYSGRVDLEVLERQSTRQKVGPVVPAQIQRGRCQSSSQPFVDNTQEIAAQGLFPQTLATASQEIKLRGIPSTRLEIAPLQYDAAAGELVVTTSLTLRVHIHSDAYQVRQVPSHHRVSGLSDYMLTLPDRARAQDQDAAKANETMLIVLGQDSYRKTIQPLVKWKERRGLNVVVKTVKELGGNSVEQIKKGVQELYDDESLDLRYLLLVGDKDVKSPTVRILSASQMDGDGVGEADYRYTLLDGDDLVGDIYVGRFSVTGKGQLKSMVDKVLYYEKEMGQDDDDADLSWIETAVGVASSERAMGPSDTERMQKIIQGFKSSGYSSLDEFYQAASPNPDELLASINKGRGFISYMGHGNGSQWVFKSGFRFKDTHVQKINAEKQWPIVMDCACTNGDFWNRDPSFSESWQRGGSESVPYGALGIVSSTIIAAWDPPAVMAEEMFAKVVSESSLTMGEMHNAGLLKMAQTFPGSQSMELTRDTFVLFGDPSLRIRAFVPQEVKVSHEMERSGGDALVFKVTRKDPKKGKVPAQHAVVALSLDGELVASAVTDKDGEAKVKLVASMEKKKFDLVISGSRLVTYESSIRAPEREEDESQDSDASNEKSEDKSQAGNSEASEASSGDEVSGDKGSEGSQESEASGQKSGKDDGKKGCALGSTSPAPGILALLFLGLRRRRRS